jgi:uncharacterized protein YqhQ
VVESVRMGSQALKWSASLYEEDLKAAEGEEAKPPSKAKGSTGVMSALALGIVNLLNVGDDLPNAGDTPAPRAPAAPLPEGEKKSRGLAGVLPILFAVALFVAAPQFGAEGINKLFDLDLPVNSPGFQAITGAAKLLIVVGYLLLIRQIAEVRRVFQYHGAEHKTISTYENRQELVVENARKMTTMHPRCGTTFLVMVALVSILVFTVVGAALPTVEGPRWAKSIGFFLVKLPFLPVVAAVTFEIQRVFARYCATGPLRALLWPGFLVQKITTAEPDDDQLEVALASLRATLWREEAVTAETPPDRVFADYEKLLADPGYVSPAPASA